MRRGVEYAAPAEEAAAALPSLARARAQRAVLDYLLARGRIPLDELKAAFPHGRTALRALERRRAGPPRPRDAGGRAAGCCRPDAPPPASPRPRPRRWRRSTAALGAFQPFLLHGVTGSGKTEVYLQVIARARERGQGRAGAGPGDRPDARSSPAASGPASATTWRCMHSGLSDAERHAEWLRLRRGEARICVGVRSAIFAPVPDLAVLVVDEEHDGSFKQEDGPAYHARDLAVVRAKLEDAVLVLGSATPSLETLDNARRGRYRTLSLAGAHRRPAPCRRWSWWTSRGCRGPAWASSRACSPPQLSAALDETLAAGQQAILFLNRRGLPDAGALRGLRARGALHRVRRLAHPPRPARRAALPLLRPDRAGRRPLPGLRRRSGSASGWAPSRWRRRCAALFPRARVGRLDRDAVSTADDTAARAGPVRATASWTCWSGRRW